MNCIAMMKPKMRTMAHPVMRSAPWGPTQSMIHSKPPISGICVKSEMSVLRAASLKKVAWVNLLKP